MSLKELVKWFKKQGYTLDRSTNGYAVTGNGIRGVIWYKPFESRTDDRQIQLDRTDCYDKPSKCPISLPLPATPEQLDFLKSKIDWLKTPEGYDVSNELDYDNWAEAYPGENVAKPSDDNQEVLKALQTAIDSLLHQVNIEGEWQRYAKDPGAVYFVRTGESDAAARLTVTGDSAATRFMQMETPLPENSTRPGAITWEPVLHTQNPALFLLGVGVHFSRVKLERYIKTYGTDRKNQKCLTSTPD